MKNKKVVFDVDGVVRNLGYVTEYFKIPKLKDWCWKYKSKDIYGWVKMNYNLLVECPSTKYLDVIKEYKNGSKLEFWSYQPKDWRPYTLKWLKSRFGNDFKIRYLKPLEKYARLQKCKDTILVEDYPEFPNYDRIVLIDRYYNKHSPAKIRIKTKEELKDFLTRS